MGLVFGLVGCLCGSVHLILSMVGDYVVSAIWWFLCRCGWCACGWFLLLAFACCGRCCDLGSVSILSGVCVTSILVRVLWLFEVLWLRCAGIGAAGCGLGGLVGGACSTLCLVFGSVLVF